MPAHVADLMRRNQEKPPERRRLPSVRLASRDELASMARVAPLLRAARDLSKWAEQRPSSSAPAGGEFDASAMDAAASALDLAPREILAAWQVVTAATELGGQGSRSQGLTAILAHGETETILRIWDAALAVVLDSEELDGIATALYTVGGPVGMDGLFDAYAGAAGPRRGPGPGEHAQPPAGQGTVAQSLRHRHYRHRHRGTIFASPVARTGTASPGGTVLATAGPRRGAWRPRTGRARQQGRPIRAPRCRWRWRPSLI